VGEGFIGLMGSASLVDDKVLKETPDGEAERKGDVKRPFRISIS
jgi:YidC/Oxa1 family membrane protein insertase